MLPWQTGSLLAGDPIMDSWVTGPVLGIETSGRLTGLALVAEGKLLGENSVDLGASTQELLPGILQDILDRHGLTLPDLSRIGVSLGPGSFTGLRVGLAWARALAAGSGVPLAGIPSHVALAFQARSTEGQVLLLTSLRRGLVCLELGQWEDDGRWKAILAGASVPVEAWSKRVRPYLREDVPLVCLGEAVEAAFKIDAGLRPRSELRSDVLGILRRPAPIAFLASRLDEPTYVEEQLEDLKLLYLRDADAKKPEA